MVKDCDTWDAGSKLTFPAWLAVIEQVPGDIAVMINPATVQTPVVVEVKVTVNDDEAVGATV
jgi:hypothetical protein